MPDTAIYLFDTREAWLNAFADAASPMFSDNGFPLPDNIRISVSEPTASKRGKGAAGKCFSPEQSKSGHYEIFLNPILETEAQLAATLTHELIHTVCFEDGHGKVFLRLARALGLEGRAVATYAGDGWRQWAEPIMAALGPIPYAPMKEVRTKVAESYTLKTTCPDCGWLARVTAKHIEPFSVLYCPVPECSGELQAFGRNGERIL